MFNWEFIISNYSISQVFNFEGFSLRHLWGHCWKSSCRRCRRELGETSLFCCWWHWLADQHQHEEEMSKFTSPSSCRELAELSPKNPWLVMPWGIQTFLLSRMLHLQQNSVPNSERCNKRFAHSTKIFDKQISLGSFPRTKPKRIINS